MFLDRKIAHLVTPIKTTLFTSLLFSVFRQSSCWPSHSYKNSNCYVAFVLCFSTERLPTFGLRHENFWEIWLGYENTWSFFLLYEYAWIFFSIVWNYMNFFLWYENTWYSFRCYENTWYSFRCYENTWKYWVWYENACDMKTHEFFSMVWKYVTFFLSVVWK